MGPRDDDPRSHGDASRDKPFLRGPLVEREGTGKYSASDIRDVKGLEKTLDAAIFAAGAMKRRDRHRAPSKRLDGKLHANHPSSGPASVTTYFAWDDLMSQLSDRFPDV